MGGLEIFDGNLIRLATGIAHHVAEILPAIKCEEGSEVDYPLVGAESRSVHVERLGEPESVDDQSAGHVCQSVYLQEGQGEARGKPFDRLCEEPGYLRDHCDLGDAVGFGLVFDVFGGDGR